MCELLQVCKSSLYYQPKQESSLNLKLMELMDVHYLEHPYKGAPRMYKYLTLDCGFKVSRNRVDRLYYEVMGLRAIMPGPHTSKRNKDHKVFPYLLRDLEIRGPNQVWATDITYIAMEKGFMYLTAVIDLYSRFIVGWKISNTMEANWCAELIEECMLEYGKPEIINTDQGAQYTSEIFVSTVIESGVKLSMDGKGRATDNAFIERFWRTIKYERLYLIAPQDGNHLFHLINDFIKEYNYSRRHSSINDYHPAFLFVNKLKVA
jgi:putative transposase